MQPLMNQAKLIVREIAGDTLTPISIYQSLKGKKKFLLESSLKHENSGRFSFIGAEPFMELKGYGNMSRVIKDGITEVIAEKPLELLKTLLPQQEIEAGPLFPFVGGAVGYAGYDAVRQYEDIGKEPEDELGFPDVHFCFLRN